MQSRSWQLKAVSALVLVSLGGCYSYGAPRGPEPEIGKDVALDINDAGREGLGGQMGPDIATVQGQLIEKDSAGYLLSVSAVKLRQGGEQVWMGERVRIRNDFVWNRAEKRFSWGRTAAFGALGLGGIGGLLAALGAFDPGFSEPGNGGCEPRPWREDRRDRPYSRTRTSTPMESVMRRLFQWGLVCVGIGAVVACKPEEVIEVETPPTAGIRFLHLSPDFRAVDFRPVDIVENSQFYNVIYRNTALFLYKNARTDQPRHYKIFLTPIASDPPDKQLADAQTVVADLDNLTLEAGKRYTVVLWGYSSGAPVPQRVDVLTDDPADPGAQVALRIINASGSPIDGRAYVTAQGAPAAPTWAAVPALSASTYANFTPSSGMQFSARDVGAAANLATGNAPAGTAQQVDFEAIPGTNVAGSAIVGIFAPRSVAGSAAPNITTAGFIFGFDRRPPRTCALCAPAQ